MSHERAASRTVFHGEELEDVLVDACFVQLAHQHGRGGRRLGRRFEDHRVAGSQRGEHAAGRDGEGEVPGWGHHHHSARIAVHLAVYVGYQPLQRAGPVAYQRA